MKMFWIEVEALRGEIKPSEYAYALLREVVKIVGTSPDLEFEDKAYASELSDLSSYSHLQSAARLFLNATKADRLAALSRLTNMDGRGYGDEFIESVPAKMIAGLVGDVSSVRCSFSAAALPALQIALAAKEAGKEVHVRFIDTNSGLCHLVSLAAIAIDVSIDVKIGQPLSRADSGSFEAEICMPPFGVPIKDREIFPRKTLDRIDASEKGRLQYEPVAMADALVHAPDARFIFNFSAGALFRTVGTEAIARGEIVDSGRLATVFAVPPSMIYNFTQIATCLVVLDPKGSNNNEVRFLDLSDERFGSKTLRGRYEINQDKSWLDASAHDLRENIPWARDVPVNDIHMQNDILAVDRYLNTQSAEALSVFLSDYETKSLGDIVEVIRPSAVPKSEDGEYTIHEISPGDIGDDGFIGKPIRETNVARGALRKARNQQVLPSDILISVKGTIGKVGIVPEDAPSNGEDGFWTAGQSLVILRAQSVIAAPVLYEYLSNSLVQDHIKSLSGGAAIQSINAKDLASLPIPVPSKDDQAQVCEEFERRKLAFKQLWNARKAIEDRKGSTWPHKELSVKNI